MLRFAAVSFCAGMIAVNFAAFWLARREPLSGSSDFSIFYTAGFMLRHGEGKTLYDDRSQQAAQEQFSPQHRGSLLPYNHPPFEGLLYVPLTYLTYLWAYLAWAVLNGAILAFSAYFLRPFLVHLEHFSRSGLALVPFAFFPAAYALMQGQDSILLLASYCLAYWALRRQRDLQAGFFLGLGLFKFHLVLPFAFVFLLRRKWRAIYGLSLAAVLEFLVSWVLVGRQQLAFYPQYAWLINQRMPSGIIVPSNMPNLRGLLLGWPIFDPEPFWARIVLLIASAGLLIWAATKWQTDDLTGTDSWNSGFSMAVIATFLAGYHGYNQDMSILLLPLLLGLDSVVRRDSSGSNRGLRIVLGLMMLSPLYQVLTFRYQHQNLFALVLLAWLACLAARSSTTPRPAWADR
jgi:hypothetical protein